MKKLFAIFLGLSFLGLIGLSLAANPAEKTNPAEKRSRLRKRSPRGRVSPLKKALQKHNPLRRKAQSPL